MVAEIRVNSRLLTTVREVYDWLDSQIREAADLAGRCDACGKCCNFGGPLATGEQESGPGCEQAFNHLLFVTTPEVMYFAANLGAALTAETAEGTEKKEKNKNKIKRSDNTKNLRVLCELGGKRKMSRCPYNIKGKCTVYEHRFAGCRIFCCKADTDFQSGLSESAIKKFKSICTEFHIPYRYTDLATALNGLAGV